MSLKARIGTTLSPWNDERGHVLVVISAGWFLSLGVRMMYPVLIPYLRETHTLSLTLAGLLLSVLWFSYAAGQLPGGILADRIGEGNIMIASTFVSSLTIVLIVVANSTVVLFAATALFGLGTALYGVARFTVLGHLYPSNLGTATGITMAAGDAGSAILPPIATFVASVLTWHFGFGFTVPIFIMVGSILWIIVPGRTSAETSAVDSISIQNGKYVLAELNRPSIIYGTGILILGNSVWQSFMGFYPTYLIEIKGISTTTACLLFGLFFALGVVIKPLAGRSYDIIGAKVSLLVVISTMGVALATLPLVAGFWPVVVATILLSSILGYGTITLSYLTDSLPKDMGGTGLGLLRTIYFMVGALSPVLFGAVAQRGFFDEAFYVLAILTVFMVVLASRLPASQFHATTSGTQ